MGPRHSKRLTDDASTPSEDLRHHVGRKASSTSISGRREEGQVSAERIRRHAVRHLGYSTLSLSMHGLEDVPVELWEEIGRAHV